MKSIISVVAVSVAVLLSSCAVSLKVEPLTTYRQTQAAPPVYVSGGQTTRSPAKCVVGSQSFGDVSEAECLKIRQDKTTVSASSSNVTPSGSAVGPKVVNGQSCAVLDKSGGVLADFLDASKNPKKRVVSSGEECVMAKKAFLATR